MTTENGVAQDVRRVLLVDDHPIVRDGLATLIGTQPDLEVCGHAASVDEALRLLDSGGADVAIVDIFLEDSNGLDLIREIKDRFPGVRVLVSSMHDETLYAERSLRAGASGYINKQEATREILTALRHVLEGRLYLSDRMSERLIRRTLGGTEHRGSVEDLSDRELQVLELIGRGLKTSDVAKRLDLSIKTVETYRQRIKVKLQLRDGADLARYAAQWLVERP